MNKRTQRIRHHLDIISKSNNRANVFNQHMIVKHYHIVKDEITSFIDKKNVKASIYYTPSQLQEVYGLNYNTLPFRIGRAHV